VKVGEAKFAFSAFELSTYDLDALADKLPFTKAVVAMIVELSVEMAVGANGAPVNVGEAKLAFADNALST
jgi:hypothetical protein